MEKYSPNWLLDKLNNSKTDAHKLMHIIDFQNNVGLHNVSKNKPLPPPPPKDREIHISGKSRHKR